MQRVIKKTLNEKYTEKNYARLYVYEVAAMKSLKYLNFL